MNKLSAVVALVAFTIHCAAQEPIVSTSRDTKKTSISIYNGGFGIVREQRLLKLEKGMNLLRYEDVAEKIDPTSLSIKSLTFPDALSIREQNYQYDLLNPESILNKSVGKSIRFKRNIGGGQTEIIEGILLNPPTSIIANSDGDETRHDQSYNGLVIRTKDNKIILNPSGEAMLDEVPAGLVPRPSLLWKLNNTKAGEHSTEVAYMTEGINWSADYVSVINENDTKLDVTGWVTLDNKSGATYADAQLQLVAGNVRKIDEELQTGRGFANVMSVMKNSEPQFQEESFFEYHLYTLDGTTTVRDNETKQMQLLSANNVSVKKKLVFDATKMSVGNYGRNPGDGSATDETKAAIVVELKNSKENNMGMPLPKGKVRVYKTDSRGTMQFVGEDRIDHTPTDETVRLYIGDAFDVVGTRRQTEFKQISKRVSETSFEVSIRNHKQSSADIYIVEHFYGDWEVVKSSAKSNKTDSRTLEFPLTLTKDETKTVTFTVRTSW